MTKDRAKIFKAKEEFLSGISVPVGGGFSPDPFQLQAIDYVCEGRDTLVVAPTGTGKTYIAIEGIKHFLAQGKRAIYTAPLKALSNTKYAEFKRLFAPDFSVGLLTGDRKIEGDAHLLVATTEIYRNDLYSYNEDFSLVILDEIHYIADPQRGPVWEESIILSPKSATLLMLSASISNPEEIAAWIKDVRGRDLAVVKESRRPVELRFGFLHPQLGVIPLAGDKGRISEEVNSFYAQPASPRRGKGSYQWDKRGRGR